MWFTLREESLMSVLLDLLKDLEESPSIETYHSHIEFTINKLDEKAEVTLLVLEQYGFEVIKETETIYTLKWDYASDDKLKAQRIIHGP